MCILLARVTVLGKGEKGYIQKEFLHHEFGDVLAAASVVVSRAGANSIYELLALRKPHLLVPLPKTSSRGDQLENAKKFCELGYSRFIEEDLLDGRYFYSRDQKFDGE